MLWADSPGRCQALSGQVMHPNIVVPDQATSLQCGTSRTGHHCWLKQQPQGCDHVKLQSDLVKLRTGLCIFLHSHGLCVAAPVKNCFHRCQPLVVFALEGLKLVLDKLAGMPGTTGTLENSLGSCKSAFFPPCSTQFPVIGRNFLCVCICGAGLYVL